MVSAYSNAPAVNDAEYLLSIFIYIFSTVYLSHETQSNGQYYAHEFSTIDPHYMLASFSWTSYKKVVLKLSKILKYSMKPYQFDSDFVFGRHWGFVKTKFVKIY